MATPPKQSATVRALTDALAQRYGMDGDEVVDILTSTVFRTKDGRISNEQLAALLIVANEYKLNPFTKELYALPDKNGSILSIVSVDGWARIINEHPQFDGMAFGSSERLVEFGDVIMPEWIECTIWRKDRAHPITVPEYAIECYRPPQVRESRYDGGKPYVVTGPWQSHPRRMLRHKAMIQCARLAFGFAGIKDQDEAERIEENVAIDMGERVHHEVHMPRAIEAPVGQDDPQSVEGFTQSLQPLKQNTVEVERAAAHEEITPSRATREATSENAPNAPRTTLFENGNGNGNGDTGDGEGDPPPPELIPAGMKKMLQGKMQRTGKTDADMLERFGFDLDGVTKQTFAEVNSWASA